MGGSVEPVVRIRCRTPEDEARCVEILQRAGHEARRSLTWLSVPDADPDAINEALVAGGALSRVAAREQIGKLLGYLIDRQGDLAGREPNLRNLCSRVLAEAGLSARYVPKDDTQLLAAGRELYQRILASGAGFLPWEGFLELFCRRNPTP
jgi:hypothetical protein